ncbi:MAG: hypothetical protein ACI30H_00070 [Paludibacteraceae bacterium]
MKKVFFIFSLMLGATTLVAKPKMVSISVEPKEAAIYVNNTFIGNGYGEFRKPKKDAVVVIRIENAEYIPVLTKFYGTDKRTNLSFTLQSDGFYRASAASGIVNKFFTVDVDPRYYTIDNGEINVKPAWKLLHQILLNYFNELSMTDMYGGYVQTPWQYKTFLQSNKQIRNRVTIRDISTPDRIAFQIKIESEVANASAAKHGEFTAIDRIVKELEPMIQELQTRIGKVSSL